MPNTTVPAAGEAMPKYTVDDAMIDVGDLAAQIEAAYAIIHELDYTHADGTRNLELDQAASLIRIAIEKARQTSTSVDTLRPCYCTYTDTPTPKVHIAKEKDNAGEAKTIADLFEGPIDDTRRMASILADLLEDGLGSDLTEYGQPDRYHLTIDQRDNILFSIYKTLEFTGQIRAAFEEALK